jgi:hypothetical protein
MGGGMAGMAMPGEPAKELWLGLRTTQRSTGAQEAAHAIPPGMAMGPTLPLIAPPRAPARGSDRPEGLPEQPKLRMLLYWGCGEAVRPGQPRVADTRSMSPVEFGKAFAGRAPSDRRDAMSAPYTWPNERAAVQVPAQASLVGQHRVAGPITPDIAFGVTERHDWLGPMSVAARGDLARPIALQWPAVPRAQGYFLQAIGHRQAAGEMVVWTSSELPDTGFGLMHWLPNDFVRKLIGEQVILPPATTRCAVPQGIFDGADGAMVRSIAYGEELNLVHPARPSDPKVTWEQIWSVRLRVKSEGMTPLGMDSDEPAADAGRDQPADRDARRARESREGADSQAARGERAGEAAPTPTTPSPGDPIGDTVNKLKGLFRF